MGVFHVFKIVRMVRNRAKHHKLVLSCREWLTEDCLVVIKLWRIKLKTKRSLYFLHRILNEYGQLWINSLKRVFGYFSSFLTNKPNDFEKCRRLYNKRNKSAEHVIKNSSLNIGIWPEFLVVLCFYIAKLLSSRQ